ncbi:MAG: 3-keto-5-aminohexanoate cleavage protein, partial [Alphaproteobacteria bacterium]
AVQNILYSPDDVTRFNALQAANVILGTAPSLLFVLGRYAANQESDPADLAPFVAARSEAGRNDRSPFMVCAFGRSETAALVVTAQQGGHCRIGFENNILMADGALAANNAERINELTAALSNVPRPAANREQTLTVLGRPAVQQ